MPLMFAARQERRVFLGMVKELQMHRVSRRRQEKSVSRRDEVCREMPDHPTGSFLMVLYREKYREPSESCRTESRRLRSTKTGEMSSTAETIRENEGGERTRVLYEGHVGGDVVLSEA